jgi:hypothetical protein
MTAAHLADRLPAIAVVRRWSQSLAVLDAIMSAEWDYRYFSFDTQFGPGQALASMRNGSGDEYSITFTGEGAFLRGFDHESPVSPFPDRAAGDVCTCRRSDALVGLITAGVR